MPSRTRKGSPSRTARSMKAPGSPSSALQMMYFWALTVSWATRHFWPVRNPAPPRPRRPDSRTSSQTSAGVMVWSARAAARKAPAASAASSEAGSMLAAIFQDHLLLMAEERDLPDGRNVGEGALSFAHPAQKETVPQVPADEDLFQEFMCRFGRQVAVGEARADSARTSTKTSRWQYPTQPTSMTVAGRFRRREKIRSGS